MVAHASSAAIGDPISHRAREDLTLAMVAGNILNAVDGGAVNASTGRTHNAHDATTTALKIGLGVQALPVGIAPRTLHTAEGEAAGAHVVVKLVGVALLLGNDGGAGRRGTDQSTDRSIDRTDAKDLSRNAGHSIGRNEIGNTAEAETHWTDMAVVDIGDIVRIDEEFGVDIGTSVTSQDGGVGSEGQGDGNSQRHKRRAEHRPSAGKGWKEG